MWRWLALILLTLPASASILRNGGGAGGGSGPIPNSVAAATATVANNALCTGLTPFYLEIGNTAKLLGLNGGTHACVSNCTAVSGPTQNITWASASKWIYDFYIARVRGVYANFTTADKNAISFIDGYSNMLDNGTACVGTTSIGVNPTPALGSCLDQTNSGQPFTYQIPALVGIFDYGPGHQENHAGTNQSEINALTTTKSFATNALSQKIEGSTGLNLSTTFNYNNPLLAGGISGEVADYITVLQAIIGGSYIDLNIFTSFPKACVNQGPNASNSNVGVTPTGGTSAYVSKYSTKVFANTAFGTYTTNPTSAYCNNNCSVIGSQTGSPGVYCGGSPINENMHYGFGWVEDDPVTGGDGAYSSAGSFGLYPSIFADKSAYLILARDATPGTNGQTQQGYASLLCGRLVRQAWITGFEQTGTIPQ